MNCPEALFKNEIIGATFCSGIGAPEVAAPWVDWHLASEIEQFPREVLQHRFGHRDARHHREQARLWGDFTALRARHFRRLNIPFPNIIVAGTPCQSFSVAGLRKGVSDDRGNLTLQFVRTAHAIQSARSDGKLAVLWENVPGVLSDKGNAFGAFLGGMVGAMDAIPCPDGVRWPSEGMVEGPRARAAWAVLDAQWFGVAQRRRRVFAVFDFGAYCDPAAILFERDSLRGDSPPRREAGQGFTHDIAGSLVSSGRGVARVGEISGQDPVAAEANQAFGGGNTSGPINVAACLTAKGQRVDFEVETFVAHTLRGEGFDASEDGTGRGVPIVAFDCKGTEVQYSVDGSHPTPRSMGHRSSHQNAGGHAAVAFDLRGRDGGAMPEGPHDTARLRAASGGSSRSYIAANWRVRRLTPRECERLQGFPDDHTLIRTGRKRALKDLEDEAQYLAASYSGMTPEEALTLAADGPRYKALGNSMAVPVVRWIMDRLQQSIKDQKEAAK